MLPGRPKVVFARFYWSMVSRLLGLQVRVIGRFATTAGGRPVVFVSNHSSWLDIPVLGGRLDACFVSKDEVGRWPFIATTDYMKTVADQIRQWVPGRYVALGTDGYGRSDAREALRAHFEVDRRWIVVAALKSLADDGRIDRSSVTLAIKKFGIDPAKPEPLES